MTLLDASMVTVILVQFGLLWYRMGRLEQHCKDVCVKALLNGRKGSEDDNTTDD